MITWRLWRALQHPPVENPIYARALRVGLIVPWYVGCVELAAFLMVVPMFLMASFSYGLGWAISIGATIARLRTSGRYDLLALTESGALHVHWAIAVAALYPNGAFTQLNSRQTWMGRAVILLILFFALVIVPRSVPDEALLTPLLGMVAGAVAIYVDHIQSQIVALLAGMLAPTFGRDGFNAQATAVMLYLSVQLGVYGAVLMAALLLLPEHVVLPLELTLRLMAVVGVLYALREVAIRVLWRALLARVNATDAEGGRLIDELPIALTLPSSRESSTTSDNENTQNP